MFILGPGAVLVLSCSIIKLHVCLTDIKSILDDMNYDRYSSSVGSLGTGNSGEAGDGPLEGSTDSGSGRIEARFVRELEQVCGILFGTEKYE